MVYFVWTRMQAEAGQTLYAIIKRKEAERIAGEGEFWWGIGNNIKNVRDYAESSKDELSVLFSLMLSRPNKKDSHSDRVCLWTHWKDNNRIEKVPRHVLCWSRCVDGRKRYALVCRSNTPLCIGGEHGSFDPSCCLTPLGKKPGAHPVTMLLNGNIDKDHDRGTYHWGFRAKLFKPWLVELAEPRELTRYERESFSNPSAITDWPRLVARVKAGELRKAPNSRGVSPYVQT